MVTQLLQKMVTFGQKYSGSDPNLRKNLDVEMRAVKKILSEEKRVEQENINAMRIREEKLEREIETLNQKLIDAESKNEGKDNYIQSLQSKNNEMRKEMEQLRSRMGTLLNKRKTEIEH